MSESPNTHFILPALVILTRNTIFLTLSQMSMAIAQLSAVLSKRSRFWLHNLSSRQAEWHKSKLTNITPNTEASTIPVCSSSTIWSAAVLTRILYQQLLWLYLHLPWTTSQQHMKRTTGLSLLYSSASTTWTHVSGTNLALDWILHFWFNVIWSVSENG